jgi:DNA-binding transcriptional MerR regulator
MADRFVPLQIMGKPLSQITFDFVAEEIAEDNAVPAAPVIEEKKQPVKKETVISPAPASKRGRKSLKDIGINADLIQIPPDEILFQKQYYSIGSVAEMFHENQSLIRYWETEFDILQPMKNRKGDRFFRPVDVKNLVMIYDLLRRRKFTIEGAKDYLKKNKKAEEKFAAIQSLQKIKGFLLELKANL